MSGSPPRTSDARLDDLERTVCAIEARLAALEAAAPKTAAPAEPLFEPPIAYVRAISLDAVSTLTLVGRTLMVLGGAYLLRALTEAEIWPPAAGVALGFAYAAAWLAAADRTAQPTNAAFHGTASLMIALPLVWEAATRFQVVSPAGSSAVLTLAAIAALAVAVHRRIQTLAWIAVGGALAMSLALTAETGAVLSFTIADIVLGVVTLWIGYTVDWVWLRWPAALVANVAALALAAGASSRTPRYAPATIVATELLLLSGYLISVAVRTLVRGREVLVFEALQSTAALAVGFGGAVYVAQTTGTGNVLLMTMALGCGAGSYAVAFAFVMRRQGVHINFVFYTSIALVLVLAGTALGFSEPALWWAGFAIACAWLARVGPPSVLTLHAAVYLLAAAATSGLFSAIARSMAGPPGAQQALDPHLAVVFGAACASWLLAPTPATGIDYRRRIARAAMGLLVAASAAAWIAALALSDQTAAGVAAAVRTATLAATALALAWLGRTTRFVEASWLVYPVLAAGAIKLLLEDFPASSAATLFVALASYGGALIVAPRLQRRPQRPG